ncbi:MAG TPA: metallopeptidase TldD-related protein [Rickettsiales bacterium]|nr:metallopeptidase TldD-related protein [Rickettsiales bacterium]
MDNDAQNLAHDLVTTAKKAGADAADALFYQSTSLSASRRMGNPEGLERSESSGIGLRVFVGKRSATVSSSDTGRQALQELVERSLAMAKLSPADEYAGLAPEELLAKNIPELDLYDKNEPTPQWLQEQCAKAEDSALAVEGITNSEGADASYGSVTFCLATSNGFAGSYKASHASVSVSVLAGSDGAIERDYDFSSACFVTDLEDAEALGKNAAHRALARLGARKIPTGVMPVVFDPRVSKGLIGAFAGAINGSSIARGTSFLKESLGKQVFGPSINIIDEPQRLRGLASKPFDGEGVAAKKLSLVENGVLQTWLLDMRSANKLGLKTTGRASRSLSSPPSPSSTNLYLAPGTQTPEALISDIKSGFYVTEVFGMGVNLVTGDYSQGASGFFIENGRRSYAVSEVTIAGKLADMFRELTPANDLVFRYGTNAPTVRIGGMTVAGS